MCLLMMVEYYVVVWGEREREDIIWWSFSDFFLLSVQVFHENSDGYVLLGGNMVEVEGEGLSYDIPPKGLLSVQCPISLSGLESMLMPKVANNGEIGRLKFT